MVEDVPVGAAGLGDRGHVVVGPSGAFLVTTCQGRVATVVRREVLAHVAGRGRTVAASLARDVERVAGLLSGLDAPQLVPVVCCDGDEDVVEQLGTVKVCTTVSLARAVGAPRRTTAPRVPAQRPA